MTTPVNVKRAFTSAGITTLLTGFMLATPMLCFSAPSEWVQWDVSSGGNGHWYKPVPGFPGLTWTLANELAQAQGGHLATITSAEENAFVFSLVANDPQYWNFCCNYSGAALGGLQQDGAPEPAGGWYWVTGEPWTYSNWGPGLPDDQEGRGPEERLHFFNPDGQWNDLGKLDFNLGGYVIERGTDVDHDGDGIADNEDECPDSALSTTVVIDGCDSGVPNPVFPSGCTIPDLVATRCAAGPSNHGQFVSCVSQLTNHLKKAGAITGQQKGAIRRCSAHATNIP